MAAVLVLVTGACGVAAAGDRQESPRPDNPVLPALETSAPLNAAAEARAEDLCDARSTSGSPSPQPSGPYDQETWADLTEFTGRAALTGDGPAAEDRAAGEVAKRWAGDPKLDPQRWDRMGNGQVACADGYLYRAVVLARRPSSADAGPYAQARYADGDIRLRPDLVYRPAPEGSAVDLALDLYLPPAAAGAALATVVLVHGGGFEAGSRHQLGGEARAYARRGFAAITVSYRLDPAAGKSQTGHRAAAAAATDDVRAAVGWIRTSASGLRVDPDRIAVLGVSAGGEIALSLAVLGPATASSDPPAAVEPRVAAAVSTGAYLTPMLGRARLDDSGAPVLLHYFETDTESGRPWSYAAATCQALRSAGSTCDLEISRGEDHVTGLGPDDPAAEWILPFLGVHLDLA